MLNQTDIINIKKMLDLKEKFLKEYKKFRGFTENKNHKRIVLISGDYCRIEIPKSDKAHKELLELADRYAKNYVEDIDWEVRKHGVSAAIQPKD